MDRDEILELLKKPEETFHERMNLTVPVSNFDGTGSLERGTVISNVECPDDGKEPCRFLG
jgi:hypothetical protein